MGQKGHIMVQKGLKMHKKRQKIEFLDLKRRFFSLAELGGTLVNCPTQPTCIAHCDLCICQLSRRWQPSLALSKMFEPSHRPGLHKLWYPGIRDRSTWGKFGAHGEHGDVFLFSNLGALWFSENLIRYSLHVCLREVKNNLFSFKHSYLRHFSWRF